MTAQVNIAEAKANFRRCSIEHSAAKKSSSRACKPLARFTPVESMTRRKPGAWRGLKIPNDALFEPMDPEDLDAVEGRHTVEFGITLPRSSEP
jgi:hypothetical protein